MCPLAGYIKVSQQEVTSETQYEVTSEAPSL
jgi:hypothetical protein